MSTAVLLLIVGSALGIGGGVGWLLWRVSRPVEPVGRAGPRIQPLFMRAAGAPLPRRRAPPTPRYCTRNR